MLRVLFIFCSLDFTESTIWAVLWMFSMYFRRGIFPVGVFWVLSISVWAILLMTVLRPSAYFCPPQFSRSVVSLRRHGLQHARPPCPSPSPRACSNSSPLSRWCHPTISSSVVPFSSRLQSFPESGSTYSSLTENDVLDVPVFIVFLISSCSMKVTAALFFN